MSVEWGGKRPDPIEAFESLCCTIIPIIVGIILGVVFGVWWFIIPMVLIVTIGSSIYFYYIYYHKPKLAKEKKDYIDLTWLKHQYYDLGRNLQDIADEQNVSMITLKKYVDKLESEKKNQGV